MSEGTAKFRDFSEMPDDELRAFADALAAVARKAELKERSKRRQGTGR